MFLIDTAGTELGAAMQAYNSQFMKECGVKSI